MTTGQVGDQTGAAVTLTRPGGSEAEQAPLAAVLQQPQRAVGTRHNRPDPRAHVELTRARHATVLP